MAFSTTFWQDFSIADRFGTSAIKDTFRRAFKEWRTNYLYLTDLVIVLNSKIWQHWENGDMTKAALYDELWTKAEKWAYDNLKGKELAYFVKMTD